MPKFFGYLNEGNPLTIRDNEAQAMVNCAIERGWIEYKDYPVPTDMYECVPNRQVKLPNGTVLRIYNGSEYYSAGYLKAYNPTSDTYSQFGIKKGDLYSRVTIERVNPVKTTSSSGSHNYGNYCECVSSVTMSEGKQQISLPMPQIHYSGNSYGSTIRYDSDFIDYSAVMGVSVKRNGGNEIPLDKSQYSILDSGNGVPVLVLANPVPEGATDVCTITWNYAFHGGSNSQNLIIKEDQTVFYAVTVKESANNYNHGYESTPVLKEANALVDSSIGFVLMKITATMPSNTGAVTPELNFYRMPFGGSEYLFDFLTSTAITNRLDSNSDSELGSMLETEGNTENIYDYLHNSIILHNDRLFVSQSKFLYYSKPSQFDQFPAENFYAFSDEVVDICKYDSNLAVFTKTRSYIIYGAGTDGFVIAEVDWKTLWHIKNSAQAIYTKLVSLVADEEIVVDNDKFPTTKRRVVCYNHRYAQDISLRVKDSLNKGVALLKSNDDLCNRNTVIENRYYVAELRYYESLTATAAQVKKFNLVYDVIADGFCLYDTSLKDFDNQPVFKYRTKEFKASTSPTPQAQYHKGIYVKGKGTFKVNVYADGELITSLTHNETDNSKPLRIILHNMGNKRASTISLEFIGTQGAQIHDWEVYD